MKTSTMTTTMIKIAMNKVRDKHISSKLADHTSTTNATVINIYKLVMSKWRRWWQ
jgi:hypothetical protein